VLAGLMLDQAPARLLATDRFSQPFVFCSFRGFHQDLLTAPNALPHVPVTIGYALDVHEHGRMASRAFSGHAVACSKCCATRLGNRTYGDCPQVTKGSRDAEQAAWRPEATGRARQEPAPTRRSLTEESRSVAHHWWRQRTNFGTIFHCPETVP
jgi:hypothetical protein